MRYVLRILVVVSFIFSANSVYSRAGVSCTVNSIFPSKTFFRVTLDHTIIIPQQHGCCDPTADFSCGQWREVVGTVVGPASGKGNITVHVSQTPQTDDYAGFSIAQLSMSAKYLDSYPASDRA